MRRALVAALLLPLLAAAGCGGSDEDAYCQAVKSHQQQLGETLGGGRPDALLKALDDFRALQGKAPSDIKDDWQQLVGSVAALQKALDEAGVDPATYDRSHPPAGMTAAQKKAIDTAAARVGSSDTAQALDALDQQARDVCHTPLTL